MEPLETKKTLEVLNLEEARDHLANSGKLSKKVEKELKRQENHMRSMITRGETYSVVQDTMNRLHDERLIPMMNSLRAVNNLAEVLVEALLRKGIITTDFLQEVQAELIEKAQQQQQMETNETVTNEEGNSDE